MATPAYMSITGTKQGLITAGAFTEAYDQLVKSQLLYRLS